MIVGGGPVGLSLAADLGSRAVPCVLVDGKAEFGEGSRGLCYAKRTLEILDRLGVGERAVAKGVTWQLGKVFHRDRLLYEFNLLPEGGHKMPAFINLQQYYLEQYLYERCQELPGVDLRFQNRCVHVETAPDHARVRLETPDGAYELEADHLIACDGSRSTVRQLMGLSFEGRVFEDRFLIADIEMRADYPGRALVLVRPALQPRPVGAAPQAAGQRLAHRPPARPGRRPRPGAQPERVRPRLEAMLGRDRPFEFEWISVYSFQCRRLERFVHGRVIFAGDAAHLVSPFGARGFNSGVQDTDNLAWKLAAVLQRPGTARPPRDLRPGARGRRRRERARLDPLDRLHHPQVARLPHDPRRRPLAGRRGALRPRAHQLGPPVDAHRLRHAALHARPRALRRHSAPRRPGARRAAHPARWSPRLGS